MITVLIVEDEPLIAEAHRTYLGRLPGFSVAGVAHTARDAIRATSEAAATETPIDLVLLDIGLPDASGIALASGLSGLRPAPDIIAITSERDLEMVRAAVGHGALAYLLKPFTFAAFRDRLERYQRYREALPAGTDAASQAEVDRALAELRISSGKSAAPKGAAPGTNEDIARAGRRVTGHGLAVSRTAGRRRHAHATDRLRQGRPPQDPLHLALASNLRERACLHNDTPLCAYISRTLADSSCRS
jgi:response regulator of citrate/malate metabolism